MKKLAIATFVSATLTACGGGGSSEPENKKPIVNKAPTVTLQSEGSYLEQSIVSITADATDSDGSITSYTWSQTAGGDLGLSGKSSETLTFTAPTVTSSTTMSFEVTVTDNDGATAKSSVTLTIEPVNESPSI
ncbi:MAG: peptidase, partial [Pseudoalteromonas sp.]|nr:peptidase [Pseudoalteromonas sp.]